MRLFFVKLLWIALLAAAPAHAQVRSMAVTVAGEASIGVKPDMAVLSAGVVNEGKTAAEASEANSRLMQPVIAALLEAGVAERDIQTSSVSIHPLHEPRTGTQRTNAFRASNRVTVTIRDISRAAAVLDRAVSAGANEISGLSFRVFDPAAALDQIRDKAIADARRKAEIYAKAAGASLGRIISIEEVGAERPIPLGLRAAPADVATPIAPGEQTLRLSILVSFELLH